MRDCDSDGCSDDQVSDNLSQIAERFGLSLSTVSHHVKELRGSGLITCEKRGQRLHCWVDPEVLRQLESFAKGPAVRERRRPPPFFVTSFDTRPIFEYHTRQDKELEMKAGSVWFGIVLVTVGVCGLLDAAGVVDSAQTIGQWWPLAIIGWPLVEMAATRRVTLGGVIGAAVGLTLLADVQQWAGDVLVWSSLAAFTGIGDPGGRPRPAA